MVHLAHLVRWQFADGRIGEATKTPFRQEFVDRIAALKNRKLARWEQTRSVTLYQPGVRDIVEKAVIDIFGAETCALCLTGGPCWFWPTYFTDYVTYGDATSWTGKLWAPRRVYPADAQVIRDLYREAVNRTTLLSSLDALEQGLLSFGIGMGQLRRGLVVARPPAGILDLDNFDAAPDEEVQVPPTPAPVVTSPVPTPVPTPPQPPPVAKDLDEVYASCEHQFDQATHICKKCSLPSRSRFSWLEID